MDGEVGCGNGAINYPAVSLTKSKRLMRKQSLSGRVNLHSF